MTLKQLPDNKLNNLCFLLFLTVALLLQSCVDSKSDHQWRWVEIKSDKHPQQFSMKLVTPTWNAIWCNSEGNNCVIIGESGNIKHSKDGGKTWRAVDSGTQYNLEVIHEVDKRLLVIGVRGNERIIVLSEDGGEIWKPGISSETNPGPDALIHSNGDKLIAISKSDAIWQSDNGGTKWNPMLPISGDFLLNSLYGESDQLVAVGQGGAIVRSLDHGKTWTIEHPSDNSSLIGIHRIGKYLVAVADNGSILRSNASGGNWGTNWEKLPNSSNFYKLGKVLKVDQGIVAIGNNGIVLRLNEFDKEWTELPKLPLSRFPSDIQSDGSELVVIGDEQDELNEWRHVVLYYKDGKSWSKKVLSDFKETITAIRSLGEGKLLAVGKNGLILLSEDNGEIWRIVTYGIQSELRAIHGEELQWIAGGGEDILGNYEELIIRSDDGGDSWTNVFNEPIAGRSITGIYGSDKQWVAIRNSDSAILLSDKGGNRGSWKPITDLPKESLYAVSHVEKQLVAVGANGIIMRSDNLGANWEKVESSGTHENLLAVHGEKNNWVAVGNNGSIVFSKNSGKNWTSASFKSDAKLRAVYGAGNQWIAVGGHSTRPGDDPVISEIVISEDGGETWQRVSNEVSGELFSVRGNGKWWVAVGRKSKKGGYSGVIALSENAGKTWTTIISPIEYWLSDIHADGQSLVAIGGYGTVMRSEDNGKTWKTIPSVTQDSLFAIHGTPDRLVTVGSDGAIVVIKPNGKLWPIIAQVDYRFNWGVNDTLSLRFKLDDRDKFCKEPKTCNLKVWGRNNIKSKSLDPIPVNFTDDGWEAEISPTQDFAIQPGQELHLKMLLEGPDFSLNYPSTNSDDIAISYQPDSLPRYLILIIAYCCIALSLVFLYWLRPLWLLSLYRRLGIFEVAQKLSIPGLSDGILMLLKVAVLLPWFITRPRVLDAWIKKNLEAFEKVFEQKEAVEQLQYYPLPLRRLAKYKSQEIISNPGPGDFISDFSTHHVLLQIIGDGGSGKTSFAAQLGRWALEQRLTKHVAVPIWLDEEVANIRPWLMRRVRELARDDDLPEVFIQALFKGKRLLLIVDRLSERQQESREAMKHLPAFLSAVILTSRYKIGLDLPDVKHIETFGLSSKTLMGFLESLIVNAGVAPKFSGLGSRADLVKRFADVITINNKEEVITPLLVTLFVRKAINQLSATQNNMLETLPTSIPDVYFEYLCSVNPEDEKVRNYLSDEKMLIAAGILACAEIGENFRPNRIDRQYAEKALAKENLLVNDVNPLQRLIDNHVLEEYQEGGDFKVSFVLDPVAEYLAAFAHAKRCEKNAKAWKKLIEDIAKQGEEAKGFMTALRITYQVYAESNGWARSVKFP